MIYYPVWVVRYSYHDRMYMDTVDGVTGQVLSGRAPGDPLFQSLAMTGGAVVGGLIAAGGLIYGSSAGGYEVPTIAFLIGLGVLFVAYRFFRHGSERVEGEFKEKKASIGQTFKQVQDLARQAGALR
jgi:hypothetical protein